MSGARSFVGGFAAAAALAATVWFLRVAPERESAAKRLADAEEATRRSKREAADAQHWAEMERERNRPLEERVKELERVLATSAPPAPGGADAKGPRPEDKPPEEWDRARINQEIENLARAPQLGDKHQRYPLVLRALRASGDHGVEFVHEILRSGLDSSFAGTAAALADGLGDPRSVGPLLERGARETDATARRLILRALANLPGDAQTPVLLAAWNDTSADPMLRGLAIQGLAVRGHETAREVAAGKEGVAAALRVRAVEWLRVCAQRGEWKDTTLVPVFAKALRTADGPAQRKLALIALEGFWSKDAIPDLNAFADDTASPPELAMRARRLIAGLEGGAPRPANAGVPERGLSAEGGE